MAEIIDLPNEDFTEKRPVTVEFRTQGFPNQRFIADFEWNTVRKAFVFQLAHVDRRTVITRSVVQPYRTYDYGDFLTFMFLDSAYEQDEVTPENLGGTMELYVKPGPRGRPVSDWRFKPDWYSDNLEADI